MLACNNDRKRTPLRTPLWPPWHYWIVIASFRTSTCVGILISWSHDHTFQFPKLQVPRFHVFNALTEICITRQRYQATTSCLETCQVNAGCKHTRLAYHEKDQINYSQFIKWKLLNSCRMICDRKVWRSRLWVCLWSISHLSFFIAYRYTAVHV